jgi:hypothetical protein
MSDSNVKAGKPETISQLSNRMISIEHSLNVINYIFNCIRGDKRRNTKFINDAKKRKAHVVFPNDSGLASGRNRIPMAFGSICETCRVGIERLACGESNWGLNSNMMDAWRKEFCHQERRSA